jgi:TorA maturation chaperone TorD
MAECNSERLATRAAFFLTLARAFQAPTEPAMARVFLAELPLDLDEMAAELGYDLAEATAAFRRSAAAVEGPENLLCLYSALFLAPPVPVHLNAAVYLDGAVFGGSEFEMGQWYARHGIVRSAGFRDLADHVAVQMEFVSVLFDRAAERMVEGDSMEALALAAEARRFLAAFPHRWLPPLRGALERACAEHGLADPYAWLMAILNEAVDTEISRDASRSPEVAISALPAGSARGFGEPTAEDLAEIAIRLEQNGVRFDHIRIRAEWSEAVFAARRAGGTG